MQKCIYRVTGNPLLSTDLMCTYRVAGKIGRAAECMFKVTDNSDQAAQC